MVSSSILESIFMWLLPLILIPRFRYSTSLGFWFWIFSKRLSSLEESSTLEMTSLSASLLTMLKWSLGLYAFRASDCFTICPFLFIMKLNVPLLCLAPLNEEPGELITSHALFLESESQFVSPSCPFRLLVVWSCWEKIGFICCAWNDLPRVRDSGLFC